MLLGLHVMCPLTLTLTWVTNFVEPIAFYNLRLNLNGTCIHPSKGSYFHFFPNDLQREKKGAIYYLKVNFIIYSKALGVLVCGYYI